ncbi:MAG TPA: VIT domain-containing protein [Nannocystaceae bacterium]|nr:VIT domain-containing protein [Nannocystaceae bacterium]
MARRIVARLLALVVAPTLACNQVPGTLIGQAGAAAAIVDAPSGAEITALTGSVGLRSPSLAEGTYFGKGAHLRAGDTVETPKGTLAELALGQGTRVRLNEDTAIVVPDPGGEPTLSRGELVAIVEGDTKLAVRLADERVQIDRGEVQLVHVGEKRAVAVVQGRARVESGDRIVELGAGERIALPLAEPSAAPHPEQGLRALAETQWSQTFEQAAAIADAVPRGIGSLTGRVPGASNETQAPLRLTDQRVTVSITGRLAHTEIEQAFANDRGAVLEGIYRFPLPGDASISALQLLVGNEWMEGEIVEKQRGRQIFAQIVDATVPRDPALLEWERGNVFKLRIFPIPGHGERRVRLSYTQVLPVVGDAVRYRFPLGGTGATGTPIDRFSFTVDVDREGLAAEGVQTSMLALRREDKGDRVRFTSEERDFQPTFDLGVDLPLLRGDAPVQSATHLDQDGQAYFMLALKPELELAHDARPSRYAFVLDRSHGTTPELWTAAHGIALAMAAGLDPQDSFTVLACDAACDELPTGLQSPSAAAIASARRFLDDQDLAGASDIGEMMIAAGEALARGGGEGRNVIVYLGDGAATSGELAPDRLATHVAEQLDDTRIEAIALGARADLVALGAIVDATGGEVIQADARDDLEALVRELRVRAAVPLAMNVRVETPAGMVAVHHGARAGLRPGDDVIVTGKLAHPVAGDVRVLADGPEGPIAATFAVDLAAPKRAAEQHRLLPRAWAQQEIDALTRSEGFGARAQIVALSQDYTVLSRFTSLLVLENDAMYREFAVTRNAGKVDRWSGALEEVAGARVHGATGTTVPAGGGDGVTEKDAKNQLDRDRDDHAEITSALVEEPPAGTPSTPKAPAPTPSRPKAPEPKRLDNGDVDVDCILDPQLSKCRSTSGAGKKAGGTSTEPLEQTDDPPPSTPTAKPKRMKTKKKSSGPTLDPFGSDPLSGIGDKFDAEYWTDELGYYRRVAAAPRLRIAAAAGPSARELARIETLRRKLAFDPTRRSSHRVLVRTAMQVGHPEALTFARAWAEADPEHAPALEVLADALARSGDPIAARAYASAIEVAPFVAAAHERLARAFAQDGDLRRACSHRRAVVSIDPRDATAHAELAKCLHRGGRSDDARRAIADGHARATRNARALAGAERELAGVTPAAIVPSGRVHATLSWRGEDDLDVAIVDRHGRRLSSLHPDGVTVLEGAGLEQLGLARVRGTMFVEITRVGSEGEGTAGPLRATLELRTGRRTRTFPVELERGTIRIAKLFWES